MNEINQILLHAADVNLLWEDINTVTKNIYQKLVIVLAWN
jgi:hypothetical protein